METVVPQRQLASRILSQLEEWIPDLDVQTVVTGLAIMDFASRALGAAENHFGRYGLSQGRFSILLFLMQFPDEDWTPAALAEASGVTRPTITGLLRSLDRDGWVHRGRHPTDGRSQIITLTSSGRSRLEAILPDHFRRIASALSAVPLEGHKALIDLMGRFHGPLAVLEGEGDETRDPGPDAGKG